MVGVTGAGPPADAGGVVGVAIAGGVLVNGGVVAGIV